VRCEQLANGARGVRRETPLMAAENSNMTLPGSFEIWRKRGETLPLAERAARSLRWLVEHTQAGRGWLYLVEHPAAPRLVASRASEPPSALVQRWITERLARELENEQTALATEATSRELPWNVMHEGELKHRLSMLHTTDGVVVGLVVLTRTSEAPPACASLLLSAVADDIYVALRDRHAERSVTAFH
jgi:hypothetical protein